MKFKVGDVVRLMWAEDEELYEIQRIVDGKHFLLKEIYPGPPNPHWRQEQWIMKHFRLATADELLQILGAC